MKKILIWVASLVFASHLLSSPAFSQTTIVARVLKTDGRSALIDRGYEDGLSEGNLLSVLRRIDDGFEELSKVVVEVVRRFRAGVKIMEENDPTVLKEGDLLVLLGERKALSVNTGVDFVNRYIWRGFNLGDSPSIQPSLTLGYGAFDLGIWSSYGFADNTLSDEIDTWLSCDYTINKTLTVTAILTDYYLPNAGSKLFNFNNHDDPDGPGAHILEAGIGLSGPESFPLSLFGYVNIYNDAGNNTYFQIDYSTKVHNADIGVFVAATLGSERNPDYYQSEDFAMLNFGITATRLLNVSNGFSVPVFVSYIVNPEIEISYVVVGVRF